MYTWQINGSITPESSFVMEIVLVSCSENEKQMLKNIAGSVNTHVVLGQPGL